MQTVRSYEAVYDRLWYLATVARVTLQISIATSAGILLTRDIRMSHTGF